MKRINLMPSGSRKLNRIANVQGKKVFVGLVVALGLFYMWHATAMLRYKLTINSQKTKLSELQLQLAEEKHAFERLVQRRQATDAERQQVAKRLQRLRDSRGEGFIWSDVLLEMSNTVSSEIWLSRIVLKKDQVIISGSSSENMVVSRFMAGLDKSPYFKNTNFSYIQKNDTTEKEFVDFEVTTQLILDKIRRAK